MPRLDAYASACPQVWQGRQAGETVRRSEAADRLPATTGAQNGNDNLDNLVGRQKKCLEILKDVDMRKELLSRLFPFLLVKRLTKVTLFDKFDAQDYGSKQLELEELSKDKESRKLAIQLLNDFLIEKIEHKIRSSPTNVQLFIDSLQGEHDNVAEAIQARLKEDSKDDDHQHQHNNNNTARHTNGKLSAVDLAAPHNNRANIDQINNNFLKEDYAKATDKVAERIHLKTGHGDDNHKNVLNNNNNNFAEKISNNVPIDNHGERTPPAANCLINLPEEISYAIDRNDQCNKIVYYIEHMAKTGQGWLIVHGMGGSGKTVLTAKAVRQMYHKAPDAFKHGIFWLNIGDHDQGSNNTTEDGFIHSKLDNLWENVQLLFSPKKQAISKTNNIDSAINQLRAHFRQRPNSLLVLDDVWSEKVVQRFRFNIPVLTTSRNSNIVPHEYMHRVCLQIDSDQSMPSLQDCIQLFYNCLRAQDHTLGGFDDLHRHLIDNAYLHDIIDYYNRLPFCIPHIATCMVPHYKACLERDRHLTNKSLSKEWKVLCELLLKKNKANKANKKFANSNKDLIEASIRALDDEDLKEKLADFGIFCEEVSIEVLMTMWKHDSSMETEQDLQSLISKSLVVKNVNSNATDGKRCYTYTVHSLTKEYLVEELKKKDLLQQRNKKLLKNYFERYCHFEHGQSSSKLNFSRLPNDQYIYHYIAHHIECSGDHSLFPKVFLENLSFIANKIRFVGPGDLLSDFTYYREHFKCYAKQLEHFEKFISSNSDILCEPDADIVQAALFEEEDSLVYNHGRDLMLENQKLYFEWTNKQNTYIEKTQSLTFFCNKNVANRETQCAVLCPTKDDFIVAAVSGQELQLFVRDSSQPIESFKAHDKTINFCTFSRDGKYILTSSDDGFTKMWRNTLKNDPNRCRKSRSGSMILDDKVDSSVPSPTRVTTPPPRRRQSSGNITSAHKSFYVDVKIKRDAKATFRDVKGIKHKCSDITNDNRFLIAGANSGVIYIFSVEEEAELDKLSCQVEDMTAGVESCAFSDDNRFLLGLVYDTVTVFGWNKRSERKVKVYLYRSLKHPYKAMNAVFMPTNNNYIPTIFTSCNKEIIEWELKEHSLLLNDIDNIDPNEEMINRRYSLAAGSSSTQQMTPNIDQSYVFSFCAISPDGKWIAANEHCHNQIFLWNHGSTNFYFLRSYQKEICSLSFNADSSKLLVTLNSGELSVLDIQKNVTFKPETIQLNSNLAVSYVVDAKDNKVDLRILGVDALDKSLRLFETHKGIENTKFKHELEECLRKHRRPQEAPVQVTCCDIANDGSIIFGTTDLKHYYYHNAQLVELEADLKMQTEFVHCEFFPEAKANGKAADDNDNNNNNLIRFIFVNKADVILLYALDLDNVGPTKREFYKLNDKLRIVESPRSTPRATRNRLSPEPPPPPPATQQPAINAFKIDSMIHLPAIGNIVFWSTCGTLFIQDYERKNCVHYENARGKIMCVDFNTREAENMLMVVARADAKTIEIYRINGKSIVEAKGERNSPSPPPPKDCIRKLPGFQTSDVPRCCRISRSGKFVVYGQDDGSLSLRDYTGQSSRVAWMNEKAHDSWINHLDISPDENYIISASKSIKLWNRHGELIQWSAMKNHGSIERLFIYWKDIAPLRTNHTDETQAHSEVCKISQSLNALDLRHHSTTTILPPIESTVVMFPQQTRLLLIFKSNAYT